MINYIVAALIVVDRTNGSTFRSSCDSSVTFMFTMMLIIMFVIMFVIIVMIIIMVIIIIIIIILSVEDELGAGRKASLAHNIAHTSIVVVPIEVTDEGKTSPLGRLENKLVRVESVVPGGGQGNLVVVLVGRLGKVKTGAN